MPSLSPVLSLGRELKLDACSGVVCRVAPSHGASRAGEGVKPDSHTLKVDQVDGREEATCDIITAALE